MGKGLPPNHPDYVVLNVNGRNITRGDILRGRQERQRKELARKRKSNHSIIKPCFIWVFHNGLFPYGGWWLYIRTRRREWSPGFRGTPERFNLEAMKLFPVGLLPIRENFNLWLPAFAKAYHRPTTKRPDKQGLAVAWATIERGNLAGISLRKEQ